MGTRILMRAAVLAMSLLMVAATATFAAVSTDSYYYNFGDTVQINGDAMQAGEAVVVDVDYPDGTLAQEHQVIADDAGNFADSFVLADGMPSGVYTVVATGQASGSVFTTTFDPGPPENVNFATSGLPAGTSVSVSYSGTNPGGGAQVGTATFTAPGPSSPAIGFLAGSLLGYCFPANISVGSDTYQFSPLSGRCVSTTLPAASSPTHTTTFTGTYELLVVSTNHAPSATVPSFSPSSPKTNDNLSASSTLTDPDSGDTISSTFLWKVMTGAFTCDVQSTPEAAVASGTLVSDSLDLSTGHATSNCSPSLGAPASINPAKGDTVYVYVTPKDNHNLSGTTQSNSVVIVNSPPTVNASGDYTGKEGANVPIAGTASDPDGDPLTYKWTATVDTADSGTTCSFATDTALSTTVKCTDNGTFTLTLTATGDPDGAVSDTAGLSLSNVAPTTSNEQITYNSYTGTATASFDFTDPGTNDTHTASFQWSDQGSAHAGVVTESAGSGSATDKRYLSPGCYTLNFTGTATDDNGGVSDTQTLTDPVTIDIYSVHFLAPIIDNQRNFAKYGNVLPVKVQVLDGCTGLPVTTGSLFLSYAKGTADNITGTDTVAETVSAADGTGGQMRIADGFYIYNFTTKPLTCNTDYALRVWVGSNGGTEILDATLSLKK